MPPTLHELTIADDPGQWAALGFDVRDGECSLGSVRLRLAGAAAGEGIVSWSLREAPEGEIDGLPTAPADGAVPPKPADRHPNTALALDHVVVFTPDLDRTIAALESAGLSVRRIREAGSPEEPVRQAFFRLGEVILEVVWTRHVEPGPARFWGLVAVVEDLDECSRRLGDQLGTVRDAVQPGRRIATVRSSAGLSVPLALMTPQPPRSGHGPRGVR